MRRREERKTKAKIREKKWKKWINKDDYREDERKR